YCNPPPTSALDPPSLHDALPISSCAGGSPPPEKDSGHRPRHAQPAANRDRPRGVRRNNPGIGSCPSSASALIGGTLLGLLLRGRSEEHTSELQSLAYLVCRLLLE